MAFLSQRFECKYWIPEGQVPSLCALLDAQMIPDAFALKSDDHAYDIHSLYLDTPGLKLFHAAKQGERNRFKLRLRFYDHAPETVFAEMKSRKGEVIQKKRSAVPAADVPALVLGHLPSQYPPAEYDALLSFSRSSALLAARPLSCVSYRRQAWQAAEDGSQIRVTLDRAVRSEIRKHFVFTPAGADAVPLFSGYQILELKYTNRFPGWFHELVWRFNLLQCGAAKYAQGIEASPLMGGAVPSR